MDSVTPAWTRRPFTTARALAAGISRKTLRGPRFTSIHPGRGIWLAADVEQTLEILLLADLLTLPPDTAVSHVTALRLYGIEVGRAGARHHSTNTSGQTRLDGITLHRRQRPLPVRLLDGIRVVTPERALVDSATMLSTGDIVRAGDFLLRHGLIRSPDHFTVFAHTEHLNGVARSRDAAPLLRERVDSVAETDVRLLICHHGLPWPEVNVEILDDHGTFLARGDLAYPHWKVLVEYDGGHHWDSADQRQQDILRRERLRSAGWKVVVITAADRRQPASIIARIWRALVESGYRGPAPRYDPGAMRRLWTPPRGS